MNELRFFKARSRNSKIAAKDTIKMVFWNTAGIRGKGNDFWDYLKEFDFIGLTETWIEENQWIKIQNDLPQGYKWTSEFAKRAHKKGRAMGGILTGVRDDIAENNSKMLDTDNIQERNIITKNSMWKILTIYNNGKTKDIYETLTRGTEGPEEHNLIIGGILMHA